MKEQLVTNQYSKISSSGWETSVSCTILWDQEAVKDETPEITECNLFSYLFQDQNGEYKMDITIWKITTTIIIVANVKFKK